MTDNKELEKLIDEDYVCEDYGEVQIWTQVKVTVPLKELDSLVAVMSMINNNLMIEDYSDIDTNLKTCYGDLIDENILNANKDIASYTDIADYIQATEPGVIVQKNGGSARYLIRGIGTNSSATDPLLMVDGVQVDSFDSVLPSQVDAIEVIKDGSASIYGMQGANGVIMITTKKD